MTPHATPSMRRNFGIDCLRGFAGSSLSYELYLSHMFVVLAAVGIDRTALGKEQAWTFTVYLPVLPVCVGLALVLEKITSRSRSSDSPALRGWAAAASRRPAPPRGTSGS